MLSPSNGILPVAISKHSTPNEYTSLAFENLPSKVSGAFHARVPAPPDAEATDEVD